jgi:hypothetical protein
MSQGASTSLDVLRSLRATDQKSSDSGSPLSPAASRSLVTGE